MGSIPSLHFGVAVKVGVAEAGKGVGVRDGSGLIVGIGVGVAVFDGAGIGEGVIVGRLVCVGAWVGVAVDVPTIAMIRNERLGATSNDAIKRMTKIAIPMTAAFR